MKKSKLFLAGILSIALVFGTVLLGCPGDTTEETDTWSAVTSLNQLDGTWKGSYSQTMTIKEAMEASGETWNDTMQALFGDIKVTTIAEITMTINASAKTRAMSMKTTMTYSGGNIDTVWTMIGSESSGLPGVTVEDAKHSITMTQDFPAETIPDDDIAEIPQLGLQINQNGKKVKVPSNVLNGELSGLPELHEFIMTKQ